MDEFVNKYREVNILIRNSYEKFGLRCLFEIEFDEKKSLSFFTEQLSNIRPNRDINSFQFFNELSSISDDIKYFTGLTYFLKPYINNSLTGKKTSFQNLEDKRYLTYSSLIFQLIYNYWDRIGELLFSYLVSYIYKKDVYLNSVLKGLDNSYKQSDHYKKLNNLFDTKIKLLFEQRHEIVHYNQLGASALSGTFHSFYDDKKLVENTTYKESLPELFKENIEYTFQGFEYAVKLINEKGSIIHTDFSFNKFKD